jgi:hypothetical protein
MPEDVTDYTFSGRQVQHGLVNAIEKASAARWLAEALAGEVQSRYPPEGRQDACPPVQRL